MTSCNGRTTSSGKAFLSLSEWPRDATVGSVVTLYGSALCTLWPSSAREVVDAPLVCDENPPHLVRSELHDVDAVRIAAPAAAFDAVADKRAPPEQNRACVQVIGPRAPASELWLEELLFPEADASLGPPQCEDSASLRALLLYLPVVTGAVIHQRWRVLRVHGGNWITLATQIHRTPKRVEHTLVRAIGDATPDTQVYFRFAKKLIDYIKTLWCLPRAYGGSVIHGCILAGPAGVGKTYAVRQASQDLEAEHITFRLREKGRDLGTLRSNLEALTAEIFWRLSRASCEERPCKNTIILFEDIDRVCGERAPFAARNASEATDALPLLLVNWFDTIEHRLSAGRSRVVCVATVRRLGDMPVSLRRGGRFEGLIHATVPTFEERIALMRALGAPDPASLAAQTPGYVASDYVRLASCGFSFQRAGGVAARAHQTYRIEHPKCLDVLVDGTNASSLRHQFRGFDALGGHHATKEALFRALAWPLLYRSTCVRLGVRPARAVLLYGPPGCGKTRLVRAAVETLWRQGAPFTFIHVSSADLYSAYLGESERTLREIFSIARSSSPALVFLDEIDNLIGIRNADTSAGASDVANRLLGTLLTEIDAMNETDAHVVLTGATNRIDRVDAALLRPGRFDLQLEVPLPSAVDRRAILELYLTRAPTETPMRTTFDQQASETALLPGSVALDELVAQTDGWSCAAIEQLCFDLVSRQAELIGCEQAP